MKTAPVPSIFTSHWDSLFHLEDHLSGFLKLDTTLLKQQLAEPGLGVGEKNRDFDWDNVVEFYQQEVGSGYLFELGAWHLQSRDYIQDTLRLVSDRAKGRVLDFGCGIGTHAIAAALHPQVDQVQCVDLNPINLEFVRYRAQQLGLSHKMVFQTGIDTNDSFDTVLCFDVVEHLPNPVEQLLIFHKLLSREGKLVINWYFSKGFDQEYPFHLDDPAIVEQFFRTLQSHFLEIFHPYLITTRCYQKLEASPGDSNFQLPYLCPENR